MAGFKVNNMCGTKMKSSKGNNNDLLILQSKEINELVATSDISQVAQSVYCLAMG
jgi:hypothetical protein